MLPSIGVTSPCNKDWELVLLLLSPSPVLKEWEEYVGEDNLGLLGAPRGVRGLDDSLFLSERDEPPAFFIGRGCGGLSGWRGFNGWRGFSSLSELLEPLLPVKNTQFYFVTVFSWMRLIVFLAMWDFCNSLQLLSKWNILPSAIKSPGGGWPIQKMWKKKWS